MSEKNGLVRQGTVKLEKKGTVDEGLPGTDTTSQNEVTTITSSELSKLFEEWNREGQVDLHIDSSLEKRISEYLEKQKELDKYKSELATRMYQPYVMERTSSWRRHVRSFYVNGTWIGTFRIFRGGATYKLISVADFKMILVALKHPYAPWIPYEADKYIDFLAFIMQNNGEVTDVGIDDEVDSEKYKDTIYIEITCKPYNERSNTFII